MTKKTFVYDFYLGEITPVKCKIGIWFLSTVIPLIKVYVCTKFNFNPFCTFQDMLRTINHYEKKTVKGRLLNKYPW